MTRAKATDILLRMAACASYAKEENEICEYTSCDACHCNVEDGDAYDAIIWVLNELNSDNSDAPIHCGVPGNETLIKVPIK